jgi:hypothetical protein
MRDAGHDRAAEATKSILADLKAFEESILAKAETLRGIWKAVEWTASGDWGPESIAEEAAALEARAFSDTSSGRVEP